MKRVFLLTFLCSIALGVTTKKNVSLHSFNAGELSPLMNARSELVKYKTGAKTLVNMLVRSQGPVQRRPGTKYIAEVKDSNDFVRLISYRVNDDNEYIVEMGDEYLRFCHDGSQVTYGESPYEVSSPYDANDIFEVQYAQDAEYMRFVHPDYPPYKLAYSDETSWAMDKIAFRNGPFLKENEDTAVKITPTYEVEPSGDITNEAGCEYDASSAYADFYTASKAFDNVISYLDGWGATSYDDEWISCKWTEAKTIKKVRIQNCFNKDWIAVDVARCKIEGSNNGSDWTKIPINDWAGACHVYDTNEALLDWTRDYELWATLYLDNDTAYTYYRVYCYDSWGSYYNWTGRFGSSEILLGLNEIEMMEDADYTGEGEVKLEATDDIFDEEHEGSLWQISHVLDSNSIKGQFGGSDETKLYYDYDNPGAGWVESDYSGEINVYENQYIDFSTHSSWSGTIILQNSYDDGTTWHIVCEHTYDYDGNIIWSGQEREDNAVYRIYMKTYNGGFPCFNLSSRGMTYGGVVKITYYVDANEVYGTILKELASTDATYKWSEGAWSDYRGWPRTIAHHEQRCIYGGSSSYPDNIWASITMEENEDYDDFDVGLGDNDADAWTYILAGVNQIQWMLSREFLMIGTSIGIGRLGQPDKPITPTFDPTFRMQAMNGSAYIQAVPAGNAILYIERGSQKVREVTYTHTSERYVAPDMTILSEHITGDGITQIAFQNRPDLILWCVREDGTLLSFTYNKDHEVLAWARHTTGDSDDFESIACIPNTNEDELWVITKREINSIDRRYIEQFQPVDWGTDQNDCWFVDCAKEPTLYEGAPSKGKDSKEILLAYNPVPGIIVTDVPPLYLSQTYKIYEDLDHLEGRDVSVFADGWPIGTYTVANGRIFPPIEYTNIIVGLPYTSTFETMPLATYTDFGMSAYQRTQVQNLTLDLYETLDFNVGTDSTHTQAQAISSLKTGLWPTEFPRGRFTEPTIYFDVNEPSPFTLRGISCQLEISYQE